ncbi:hypothetical protein [Halarchaeum acidiphilum]|uniref:hypothetical protein n=1 Tax=Halarchaeum acidiphilum TaxID=489138 RepID=UPI000677E8DF|nr:hypothetical protein [Halarchaeum acidiphilum]
MSRIPANAGLVGRAWAVGVVAFVAVVGLLAGTLVQLVVTSVASAFDPPTALRLAVAQAGFALALAFTALGYVVVTRRPLTYFASASTGGTRSGPRAVSSRRSSSSPSRARSRARSASAVRCTAASRRSERRRGSVSGSCRSRSSSSGRAKSC